jgi:uncharacterized membrane protein YfcA
MNFLEIVGYFFGLLMGITLGLIGAGGSTMTVPIMVYLFGLDTILATTYSLFVVGFTTLIGSYKHYKLGNISWKFVLLFGIPSIVSVVVSRTYLIHLIPDIIVHSANFTLSKNTMLLVIFACMMLFASISMIRNNTAEIQDDSFEINRFQIVLAGVLVGFITGIVGVGGGFLIIPVLTNWAKLSIKKSVATSLIIITINSLIGFSVDHDGLQRIDWIHMFIFSLFAIIGITIGVKLSTKIPGEKLKPLFGWFILIMGISILLSELIN